MWKWHRKTQPTNAGCPFHDIRQGRYAKDGSVELYVVETINIQDNINSHRFECDLDRILAQLRAGDTSVVNRNIPFYGSFEKIPTNYADILNSFNDAQYAFNRLDSDTKKRFDNDFNKWFANVGSYEWYSAMGMIQPMPVKPDIKVEDKEVPNKE